jgi:hypothetical protein
MASSLSFKTQKKSLAPVAGLLALALSGGLHHTTTASNDINYTAASAVRMNVPNVLNCCKSKKGKNGMEAAEYGNDDNVGNGNDAPDESMHHSSSESDDIADITMQPSSSDLPSSAKMTQLDGKIDGSIAAKMKQIGMTSSTSNSIDDVIEQFKGLTMNPSNMNKNENLNNGPTIVDNNDENFNISDPNNVASNDHAVFTAVSTAVNTNPTGGAQSNDPQSNDPQPSGPQTTDSNTKLSPGPGAQEAQALGGYFNEELDKSSVFGNKSSVVGGQTVDKNAQEKEILIKSLDEVKRLKTLLKGCQEQKNREMAKKVRLQLHALEDKLKDFYKVPQNL